MEHRYAPREPLEVEVLLRTPDGPNMDGHLKDISRTGAALVIAGPPPPGNIVEVSLRRPFNLPPSVESKARGYVVCVKGNELGVLWIDRCGWERLVDGNPQLHSQRLAPRTARHE